MPISRGLKRKTKRLELSETEFRQIGTYIRGVLHFYRGRHPKITIKEKEWRAKDYPEGVAYSNWAITLEIDVKER